MMAASVTFGDKKNRRPARNPNHILIDPAIDAAYRAMTPPCTNCGCKEYTRFRYFNNKNAVLSRSEKPQARFACRSPACLAANPGKSEVEFNWNGKKRGPYAKKNKKNTLPAVSAAPEMDKAMASSSKSRSKKRQAEMASSSNPSSNKRVKPTPPLPCTQKEHILSYDHAFYDPWQYDVVHGQHGHGAPPLHMAATDALPPSMHSYTAMWSTLSPLNQPYYHEGGPSSMIVHNQEATDAQQQLEEEMEAWLDIDGIDDEKNAEEEMEAWLDIDGIDDEKNAEEANKKFCEFQQLLLQPPPEKDHVEEVMIDHGTSNMVAEEALKDADVTTLLLVPPEGIEELEQDMELMLMTIMAQDDNRVLKEEEDEVRKCFRQLLHLDEDLEELEEEDDGDVKELLALPLSELLSRT